MKGSAGPREVPIGPTPLSACWEKQQPQVGWLLARVLASEEPRTSVTDGGGSGASLLPVSVSSPHTVKHPDTCWCESAPQCPAVLQTRGRDSSPEKDCSAGFSPNTVITRRGTGGHRTRPELREPSAVTSVPWPLPRPASPPVSRHPPTRGLCVFPQPWCNAYFRAPDDVVYQVKKVPLYLCFEKSFYIN